MGTYGGLSPQPERYGGGSPRLEMILAALLHADETFVGLDTTPPWEEPGGGQVWIEDMAMARALDAAWSTNIRAANEFDPLRTQSMLARWETLFGVIPFESDTPVSRRARINFKWLAFGKNPTYQQFVDDLTFLAPNVFVGITTTSSATGPNYYSGSSFTNPYVGTFFPALIDWWSNVLHLAIQVQQPSSMPTSTFNDYVSAINGYLDGALPAWSTWSVYQSVGFFLGQANLDVEALRV